MTTLTRTTKFSVMEINQMNIAESEKLVSIILPVYNGEKYLKLSIESIISQTHQNWELIIVNDCSTDNSLEIAKEYASKDKRIKIITNKKNEKLPKSLNIGFSNANGEFYTWTSDDNIYKPNAIATMVEILIKTNYDMVSANMDFIDDSGKKTGSLSQIYKVRELKHLIENNNIMACFLYTKQIAEKIGKYNESTFGVEDYDYWFRIALNGKILYINDNLYQYRYHKYSLTSLKKETIIEKACDLRIKYFYSFTKKLNFSDTEQYNYAINLYKKTNRKEFKIIAKKLKFFEFITNFIQQYFL